MNNLLFLLLFTHEKVLKEAFDPRLWLRSIGLEIRLCDTDAANGFNVWWNLLFGERWSILQIEAEDFAHSVLRVSDVRLGPGRVGEACVGIYSKDFVVVIVFYFFDITSNIYMLAKVLKTFYAVAVECFDLEVLVEVIPHEFSIRILT